jgi:protein-tyrosine phosphatase
LIDLHAHILPGMDDGSPDMETSLDMARVAATDGILVMACTPQILPGLYEPAPHVIEGCLEKFQQRIANAGITIDVVAGSVVHHRPDFMQALMGGKLTTLNNSRYLLVELPGMVPPPRLEEVMARALTAGYVPIIAQPERLRWIDAHYGTFERLVENGVWLQLTAGSLTGHSGRQALYWAERLLDAGMVHMLATGAHNLVSRPPILSEAYEFARSAVGADEALNLVSTRPVNILDDEPAENSPPVAFTRARSEEPRWLWPRLVKTG